MKLSKKALIKSAVSHTILFIADIGFFIIIFNLVAVVLYTLLLILNSKPIFIFFLAIVLTFKTTGLIKRRLSKRNPFPPESEGF